jgi:hypothetical protein
MRRRRRSFTELLTRSLALAGLAYALVIAYAVPATVFFDRPSRPAPSYPGASHLSQETDVPAWRPTHAKRFPGCVDMASWPGTDVPTSVVVVRRDGQLRRISFDEAFDRATSTSAADDVWTIGACS